MSLDIPPSSALLDRRLQLAASTREMLLRTSPHRRASTESNRTENNQTGGEDEPRTHPSSSVVLSSRSEASSAFPFHLPSAAPIAAERATNPVVLTRNPNPGAVTRPGKVDVMLPRATSASRDRIRSPTPSIRSVAHSARPATAAAAASPKARSHKKSSPSPSKAPSRAPSRTPSRSPSKAPSRSRRGATKSAASTPLVLSRSIAAALPIAERQMMSTAERVALMQQAAAQEAESQKARAAARPISHSRHSSTGHSRKPSAATAHSRKNSTGDAPSIIAPSTKGRKSQTTKKASSSSSSSKKKKNKQRVLEQERASSLPPPRRRGWGLPLRVIDSLIEASARGRVRNAPSSPDRALPKQPSLARVLSPSYRVHHPPIGPDAPPVMTRVEMEVLAARRQRERYVLEQARQRLAPATAASHLQPLQLPDFSTIHSQSNQKHRSGGSGSGGGGGGRRGSKSPRTSSVRSGRSSKNTSQPASPKFLARTTTAATTGLLSGEKKRSAFATPASPVELRSPKSKVSANDQLLLASMATRQQVQDLRVKLEQKQAALKAQWQMKSTTTTTAPTASAPRRSQASVEEEKESDVGEEAKGGSTITILPRILVSSPPRVTPAPPAHAIQSTNSAFTSLPPPVPAIAIPIHAAHSPRTADDSLNLSPILKPAHAHAHGFASASDGEQSFRLEIEEFGATPVAPSAAFTSGPAGTSSGSNSDRRPERKVAFSHDTSVGGMTSEEYDSSVPTSPAAAAVRSRASSAQVAAAPVAMDTEEKKYSPEEHKGQPIHSDVEATPTEAAGAAGAPITTDELDTRVDQKKELTVVEEESEHGTTLNGTGGATASEASPPMIPSLHIPNGSVDDAPIAIEPIVSVTQPEAPLVEATSVTDAPLAVDASLAVVPPPAKLPLHPHHRSVSTPIMDMQSPKRGIIGGAGGGAGATGGVVTSSLTLPPMQQHHRQRSSNNNSARSGQSSSGDNTPRYLLPLKRSKSTGRYGAAVLSPAGANAVPTLGRRSSVSSTTSSRSISSTRSGASTASRKKKKPTSKAQYDENGKRIPPTSSAKKKKKQQQHHSKKKGSTELDSSEPEVHTPVDEVKARLVLPDTPPTPPRRPPPPPLTDEERLKLGFQHMAASARYSARLNDGLIDALQMWRRNMLRRALTKWRTEYSAFRHQSFFHQWVELTRTRIAAKLYCYKLARRSLAHWILEARYSIGVPPIQARWSEMRRKELLAQTWVTWREAFWSRFHHALVSYSDKMFRFLQTRRAVRTWLQWKRDRVARHQVCESIIREGRRNRWYIRWHQVINRRVHRDAQKARAIQVDRARVLRKSLALWTKAHGVYVKDQQLRRLEKRYAMSQVLFLQRHWRARVVKTLDLRHNFTAVTEYRMRRLKRTLFQQWWNWFCAIMYERNRQLTAVRRKALKQWKRNALHPDHRRQRELRLKADEVCRQRVAERVHGVVDHWVYYRNMRQHFRRQTQEGREWADGRGAQLATYAWWMQWKRQIHRRYLGRTGVTIHKNNRDWAKYATLRHWYNIYCQRLRKRQNYEAAADLLRRTNERAMQVALDRWWMAYEVLVRAPVTLVNLKRILLSWRGLRDDTSYLVQTFKREILLRKFFSLMYNLFAERKGLPNKMLLRRKNDADDQEGREQSFMQRFMSRGSGGQGDPMATNGGMASRWEAAAFGGATGAAHASAAALGAFSFRNAAAPMAAQQPPQASSLWSSMNQQPYQVDHQDAALYDHSELDLSALAAEAEVQALPSMMSDDKFTFYRPKVEDDSSWDAVAAAAAAVEKATFRSPSRRSSGGPSPGTMTPPTTAKGQPSAIPGQARKFPVVVIPEEQPKSSDSTRHGRGGAMTMASRHGPDDKPSESRYRADGSDTTVSGPPAIAPPDADKFLPSAADAEWQFELDFQRGMRTVERPEAVRSPLGSWAVPPQGKPKRDEWTELAARAIEPSVLAQHAPHAESDPKKIDWERELHPLAVSDESGELESDAATGAGEKDEFDLEVARQEKVSKKERDRLRAEREEKKRVQEEKEQEAIAAVAAAKAAATAARAARRASVMAAEAAAAAKGPTATPAMKPIDPATLSTSVATSVHEQSFTAAMNAAGAARDASPYSKRTPLKAKTPVQKRRAASASPSPRKRPAGGFTTPLNLSASHNQSFYSPADSSFRRSSSGGLLSGVPIGRLPSPVKMGVMTNSFAAAAPSGNPFSPATIVKASEVEMSLDDLILSTPPPTRSPPDGAAAAAVSSSSSRRRMPPNKLFGSPRQMGKALLRQYNTSHPNSARNMVAPNQKHVESLLGFKYAAPPNWQIQHPSQLKAPLPLAAQARSLRLHRAQEKDQLRDWKLQAQREREVEAAHHFAQVRDMLGPAADKYAPMSAFKLPAPEDEEEEKNQHPKFLSPSELLASARAAAARRGRSPIRQSRTSVDSTRTKGRSSSRPSGRDAWLENNVETGAGPADEKLTTQKKATSSSSSSNKKKAVAWTAVPDPPPSMSNLPRTARSSIRRPSASRSTSSATLVKKPFSARLRHSRSRSKSPRPSLARAMKSPQAARSISKRPASAAQPPYKPFIPHFPKPPSAAASNEPELEAKVGEAWEALVASQPAPLEPPPPAVAPALSGLPAFPTIVPSFPVFLGAARPWENFAPPAGPPPGPLASAFVGVAQPRSRPATAAAAAAPSAALIDLVSDITKELQHARKPTVKFLDARPSLGSAKKPARRA